MDISQAGPDGSHAQLNKMRTAKEIKKTKTMPDSTAKPFGVLIFRLGVEWLAFRTQTIAEVTNPRPVHRVPHRSNEIFVGLVNLQGQVQLCVSLHGLLGVPAPSAHTVGRAS